MRRIYMIIGLFAPILLILYLVANPVPLSLFGHYVSEFAALQVSVVVCFCWCVLCPKCLDNHHPVVHTCYMLLPVEFLLFLFLSEHHPYICGTAAILVSILAAVLILRRKVLGRRVYPVIISALFFEMLPFAVIELGVYRVERPRQKALSSVWEKILTIEGQTEEEIKQLELEYASDLKNLDNAIWASLSLKEQLNSLQALLIVESAKLGLSSFPSVIATALPPTTYAQYLQTNNEIWINSQYLKKASSLEITSALLHEIFHAAQTEAVSAVDWSQPITNTFAPFHELLAWRNDIFTYSSPNDDFESYSTQALEIDAEAYAEAAVASYQIYIAPSIEPCGSSP